MFSEILPSSLSLSLSLFLSLIAPRYLPWPTKM